MTDTRAYPAIDAFRLIAALLVIAIHTAPLADISVTADFLLTRVLGRTAVPFFFIVSGFFVLPRGTTAVHRFVKRTALLYGAALILYLPINLYMGTFHEMNLLTCLRLLVVDGTMYHLWYLPAVMLGMLVSHTLLRCLGYGGAIIAALVLYAIGLGGDSYYGLVGSLPFLDNFYAHLFLLCDYTRNGLFFAPIFLLLGAALAAHPLDKLAYAPGSPLDKLGQGFAAGRRGSPLVLSKTSAAVGTIASLMLMSTEALLLRTCGWPRHDSMTLFLLPVMVCLFTFLLHFRGRRLSLAADTAMLVYILHPLMILVVRFTARLTHTQMLFIDNTLLHFSAVSLLSFSCAFMLSAFKHALEGRPSP